MEKYGVSQDVGKSEPGDKTAQTKTSQCTACGGKLRPREETGVIICVRCGSKPYER